MCSIRNNAAAITVHKTGPQSDRALYNSLPRPCLLFAYTHLIGTNLYRNFVWRKRRSITWECPGRQSLGRPTKLVPNHTEPCTTLPSPALLYLYTYNRISLAQTCTVIIMKFANLGMSGTAISRSTHSSHLGLVWSTCRVSFTWHQGCGSGLDPNSIRGSGSWIRIRIQEGKNDPQK